LIQEANCRIRVADIKLNSGGSIIKRGSFCSTTEKNPSETPYLENLEKIEELYIREPV
jgi:hypothetical protein